MEELTENDIRAFVAGSFADCGGYRELQSIYPSECDDLQDDIVTKA
jgi:hypothetical protein